MIFDLGGGKEIVITGDKGGIRLTLWANRGCMGLTINPKQAIKIRTALLSAILEAEKCGAG
jgi:hypothetical protein